MTFACGGELAARVTLGGGFGFAASGEKRMFCFGFVDDNPVV